MDISRAKEIVRILADGIDPITGEILPEESVYNAPEVIRALYTLLDAARPSSERSKRANAGTPWTEDEENQLRQEFGSNMDIAAAHGRSRSAIESRLERLGLWQR